MGSIHAKKSLGQHFLRSEEVVTQIVDASGVAGTDVVVEVGPGEGVLTEALLAKGARVIVVEKDERCIPVLHKRFSDAVAKGQLEIIEGDVLEGEITEKLFSALKEHSSYKVVANIPYYITGMLFRYFLEEHRQPSVLTFLIQKEVAEQIISKDGKESILSLSIKAFGEPHYVATVGKAHFNPPPKVDSAILTVHDINTKKLEGVSPTNFFQVVKAGFRARRKMLIGNLAEGLAQKREELSQIFNTIGIDEKVRGEDVPIEKWIALTKNIYSK